MRSLSVQTPSHRPYPTGRQMQRADWPVQIRRLKYPPDFHRACTSRPGAGRAIDTHTLTMALYINYITVGYKHLERFSVAECRLLLFYLLCNAKNSILATRQFTVYFCHNHVYS